MQSLAYKNLIWKSTWYKKQKPTEPATEKKPEPEAAAPAVRSPKLDHARAAHWQRAVKHGLSKV